MIKAEEIDGYRGCDDLDSILDFIEKGDEKKAKSGSKRTSTLGRNRVESPSLSGSVASKQRLKQQPQGKNSGSVGVEKGNASNKKITRKKSQTPADGTQKNEVSEASENTFTQPSSIPTSSKDLDKKRIILTPHSSSSIKTETGIQDEYLTKKSPEIEVKGDATNKYVSDKNGETLAASRYLIHNYEEEDDEDDTPFVMIRRVNNHSNANKSSKAKSNADSGTLNAPNKTYTLSSHGTRNNIDNNNINNNNNRYGNKPSANSANRNNTLKRKSKNGTNEMDEYHLRGMNGNSVQLSKQGIQVSQSHTINKSNGHISNFIDTNSNNTHDCVNETQSLRDDQVNGEKSDDFKSINILDAKSEISSEVSNTNLNAADGATASNMTTSFSSVVQSKKAIKSSRGKAKNKSAWGFNHKQFIDAALNDLTSVSKQNKGNASMQNNSSDSSKLKISNTFVAEAMLPEPVLEYSRKHSSHSPPPTQQNVDLRNTTKPIKEFATLCDENDHNYHEDKIRADIASNVSVPSIKNVNEHNSNVVYVNSDNEGNATKHNDDIIRYEEDASFDYHSGGIFGSDGSKNCRDDINEASLDLSTCNNKYQKLYSSAVIASPDPEITTDGLSSRASNIDEKPAKGIERNKDTRGNDTAKGEQLGELEEFKMTNLVCKGTGLSTSISPISSRSSSITWYEEEDDCTEGTFNYTTILNFIKSGKWYFHFCIC